MSGWAKAWPRAARPLAAMAVAVMMAALGAAYWTALASPAVGAFHDDGIYAVTAKSLATGRGYRILSLPGESVQTKYPVLFPALLAAVWKLAPRFPGNVIWLKTAPFACALVWWILGYVLIRRETGSAGVALALTGLVAAAPWILFLATALLSETLFAALVTGALLLVGRAERKPEAIWAAAGAGVLAGAAFLTRTAGVALIPAGAMALLAARRAKAALLFVLIASAMAAPWVVWQAAERAASLEPYYSRVNYESWNILSHFSGEQKIRIAGQNLVTMLLAPAVLLGAPANAGGVCLTLVVGGLAAVGLAARLAGRPRALEIFTVLYAAMVVCWAWPPVRFLAPLLPVILLYGYLGIGAVGRALKFPRPWRAALAGCAGLVLAAQSGWALSRAVAEVGVAGSVKLPNTPQDDWRETAGMLAFIADHTPAGAVVMSNLDPVVYLYTGRKSVRGFSPDPYLLHYSGDHWADRAAMPLGSAGALWAAIERYGVTYLVCAPNAGFREGRYLAGLDAEVVALHAQRLRLVYEAGNARYRIYAVTLGKLASNLSLTPNFQENAELLASNQVISVQDRTSGGKRPK